MREQDACCRTCWEGGACWRSLHPYVPPKPDWLVKCEQRLALSLASEDEIEVYLNRLNDPNSLHYWQKGGEYVCNSHP